MPDATGGVSAVLFLDLDRFKLVNDSLGHVVGDQLLIAIARRLERCLRAADTVARVDTEDTIARLGGDEFTILLEDIRHARDAVRVAERIQDCLKQPFELDGRELFTSASIGIATSETAYTNPQDLLRDADTAMYRAKALGKARYEVFDASMREQPSRASPSKPICAAPSNGASSSSTISRSCRWRSGNLDGFEALVRWRHPQRGMVSPQHFIGVAEETGLIVPLGTWVLQRACARCATGTGCFRGRRR